MDPWLPCGVRCSRNVKRLRLSRCRCEGTTHALEPWRSDEGGRFTGAEDMKAREFTRFARSALAVETRRYDACARSNELSE